MPRCLPNNSQMRWRKHKPITYNIYIYIILYNYIACIIMYRTGWVNNDKYSINLAWICWNISNAVMVLSFFSAWSRFIERKSYHQVVGAHWQNKSWNTYGSYEELRDVESHWVIESLLFIIRILGILLVLLLHPLWQSKYSNRRISNQINQQRDVLHSCLVQYDGFKMLQMEYQDVPSLFQFSSPGLHLERFCMACRMCEAVATLECEVGLSIQTWQH